MAKRVEDTDEDRDSKARADDESEDASSEEEEESEDSSDDGEEEEEEAEGESADAASDDASDGATDDDKAEAAESKGEELAAADDTSEEEVLPAQLGTQKYVFAAFFAGALLFAYITGRILETIWSALVSKDFFVKAAIKSPTFSWFLTADDDRKSTATIVTGGIIAVAAVLYTYRKPSVRSWAEEVSTELSKVKWPNRKEVQGSTVVVLATSAIATLYLFLLDRFWGFVTNLFYGTGT